MSDSEFSPDPVLLTPVPEASACEVPVRPDLPGGPPEVTGPDIEEGSFSAEATPDSSGAAAHESGRVAETDEAPPEGPSGSPEPADVAPPIAKARIVAIANQKGGVGKTTTAVNLSAALAQRGARVLLVDLDPQANASSGLGVPPGSTELTTYDVILGRAGTAEAIRHTELAGLDLIPAIPGLAGAEVELVGEEDWEHSLSRRLDEVSAGYQYIFIDCPPSLGILTLNGLSAAASILIPVQCEYYALEGLGHLMETVRRVQERLNTELRIEGVLLTMFDGRLNLSMQVAEEARRHFGDRVYRTMIPRNVRLGEAPSFGKPITVYDPICIGAVSYDNLAKEILGQ